MNIIQTKFTKGLWRHHRNEIGDILITSGSRIIAVIYPDEEMSPCEISPEDVANANLLAAAPDMHDALLDAEAAIETLHGSIMQHHATNLCESRTLFDTANHQLQRLSNIRAARGKAEGRPV